MGKRKRHIGLNELEWEALESIQQEYHFSSLGNAVSFLISNYNQQNSSITQAKLIASVIKDELKPMYDVLRNRTGYANKATHIMLDMFNEFIINSSEDVPPNVLIKSVRTTPSNMYQAALSEYDAQIQHFQENAKNKHMNRADVDE